MIKYPKILCCRKCGDNDAHWWDGCGTQAELSCNNCGQEEGLQVSDLFDYDDPRRSITLNPPEFKWPDDVIKLVYKELAKEWNKRAS